MKVGGQGQSFRGGYLVIMVVKIKVRRRSRSREETPGDQMMRLLGEEGIPIFFGNASKGERSRFTKTGRDV